MGAQGIQLAWHHTKPPGTKSVGLFLRFFLLSVVSIDHVVRLLRDQFEDTPTGAVIFNAGPSHFSYHPFPSSLISAPGVACRFVCYPLFESGHPRSKISLLHTQNSPHSFFDETL
jgi:hypothetical protein